MPETSRNGRAAPSVPPGSAGQDRTTGALPSRPRYESRMRARADAFQTAIERAPLDISLGILSRAVTDEVPEARTAFYVAGLDIAHLHPIRGGDDALESYAPSWACPIATSDGKSIGLFAVYLPEPRDMTADERELVDTTTHAAAVIISRYTADRQRADTEVTARQHALLQV